MKNIFGDESFERLYETIEDGKQEVFEFHLPIGKVRHSFIKREISVQIDGEVYYDITTPYSYGGPVVFEGNEDYKWELVDEFQRAFQTYCEENKIVSEYVRFDPIILNVLDFASVYEVEAVGEIIKSNSEVNNICIGKKRWNEKIYKEICEVVQIGTDADFFPAYRYKEYNQSSLKQIQKI